MLYAVSDEIHQYFVPTRGPSLEDVLIDCAGIIIFYVSLKYLKKFIRKL
ncbi:MAG: VanZ family protein [Candidatus Omnitrophica bacterium]|nr:VanZ family protein [Candidatus Omnitrophota bacterium]